MHDGFYAAANIGLGYLKSSGDGNPTDIKGITTPLSLWTGYTYGAMAFGAGITTDTAWYPTYRFKRAEEGDIGGSGLSLFGLALFVDIYPDPKRGGFHIMPSFGGAFMFPVTGTPAGVMFGLGLGYDYWVGPQVSMGVMARLTWAPLHASSAGLDNASYTTYAPALLYTVTYQ